MIEPGKNGRRSRGVARGAARQVASKKTGIHLTWILPSTARRPGSAPAIREPWHNVKLSSDLRTPRSARPGGIPLHNDPDVRWTPLDRQRPPPMGGQIPPSEKRLERHTVKRSIIASEGAVGSAARSSASRVRQCLIRPYRPITLSSLLRMPRSMTSISRRIWRPVADTFARARFGSARSSCREPSPPGQAASARTRPRRPRPTSPAPPAPPRASGADPATSGARSRCRSRDRRGRTRRGWSPGPRASRRRSSARTPPAAPR